MRNHMQAVLTHWSGLIISVAMMCSTACADSLVPVLYTATPGQGQAQGGQFNYFDDTGRQLTDGVFGANNWSADLGNGRAYEWVAWQTVDPVITFNFAGQVTVNAVLIDFNRNTAAGIALPASVTIGAVVFNLTGTEVPDGTRGTVAFTGSWTGSSLGVSMASGQPRQWMFLDEMGLQGTPVPEPSSAAIALTGLAGLLALRRFRAGLRSPV